MTVEPPTRAEANEKVVQQRALRIIHRLHGYGMTAEQIGEVVELPAGRVRWLIDSWDECEVERAVWLAVLDRYFRRITDEQMLARLTEQKYEFHVPAPNDTSEATVTGTGKALHRANWLGYLTYKELAYVLEHASVTSDQAARL